MEMMFDEESFQEEITNASEAGAVYKYFTHNLTKFRKELQISGLSYSEAQKKVEQCWKNLIQSSERVGYTNGHIQRMKKLLKD